MSASDRIQPKQRQIASKERNKSLAVWKPFKTKSRRKTSSHSKHCYPGPWTNVVTCVPCEGKYIGDVFYFKPLIPHLSIFRLKSKILATDICPSTTFIFYGSASCKSGESILVKVKMIFKNDWNVQSKNITFVPKHHCMRPLGAYKMSNWLRGKLEVLVGQPRLTSIEWFNELSQCRVG